MDIDPHKNHGKGDDPEKVNPSPPSRGHGDRLNRLQERAIQALMTSPSVVAAAQAVELHPNTLRRWLRLPHFRAAFEQANQQLLRNSVNRLQVAAHTAIESLEGDLEHKNVNVRQQAASMILNYTMRGTELLDLTERVSQLETALKGETSMSTLRRRIDRVAEKVLSEVPAEPVTSQGAEITRHVMAGMDLAMKREFVAAIKQALSTTTPGGVPATTRPVRWAELSAHLSPETFRVVTDRLRSFRPGGAVYGLKETPA